MKIVKRLGRSASELGACTAELHCPDVFLEESGDFLVIGEDVTAEARSLLPAGSGCGEKERIVRIPRAILVQARTDIPSS